MDTNVYTLIDSGSQTILNDRELYAVPVHHNPALVTIHDCDGFAMFRCSATINAVNLQAIIDYGKNMYTQGQKDGADCLRRQLHALTALPEGDEYAKG